CGEYPRRDPVDRAGGAAGAGRCDRTAPLSQLISLLPTGIFPTLNAADRTTGCGNFLVQQEIVMTAKYPSARRRVPASLLALSLALAIAAARADAAETAGDAASADDAAAQVEGGSYGGEILVTARRRSETAQDVPIAISVVDGEQIDNTGSFNVGRLTQLTPTLQFYSSNPRNTAVNIRGIGAPFGLTNDGIEQGVGIYVDDVYYSRV